MNSTQKYKGYTARIEFDPHDELFVGRVSGLTGSSLNFYGAVVNDVVTDFHNAVDRYLTECERTGQNPGHPFGGKLVLYVKPDIYAAAALAARAAGKNLNQWAEEVIERATKPDMPQKRPHHS